MPDDGIWRPAIDTVRRVSTSAGSAAVNASRLATGTSPALRRDFTAPSVARHRTWTGFPTAQALGYDGAALAPLMAIPRQACRPLVVALAALVLLTMALPALPGTPVAAQDICLGDIEPNDAPETAPITSGGFCLEGELAASDQDLLIWELPAGEAAGLWTVELDGVPGTLTTLRLLAISSPPGVVPIVVDRTLLTLDAPPESWGRTASDELLLPAGRLLIGVSRTDLPDGSPPPSTGYRVALRPGSALPPSGDVEPNEVPEAASPVEAAFDISGDLFGTSDLFEWRVPAPDDGRRWFVDLSSVLGASFTLRLLDDEGRYLATTLTDPLGRARLVDLALAPGRYRLSVEGALDRTAPYRLRAVEGVPVGDAEPNGEPSFGLAIDPSASPVVRGQLFPYGDVDRYRFTVPEGDPGLLRDIKAFSPGTEHGRRLCLGLPDGTALQCQDGRGDVVLRSLLLPPGDYEVALSGDPDEAVPYVLRIEETLAPAPDFELEPNDTPNVATPWQPLTIMRGVGANGEPDTFRLAVSGDAQLWEISAIGPGVNQLSWLKADGRDLAREDVSGTGEAVLTDLYLTPGDQWFRVVATGEYRLEAVPLGPPDPAGEREPNDGAAFAEPYRLSREHVTGRLPRAGDMDVFRFSLAAPEHLILHLRPPADSAIDLSLESGGRVGERHAFGPGAPIDYDVSLPPGDYEVWLRTLSPSQERYTFSIERADSFSFPGDREPNDTRESAAPLPETPIIEGSGDPRGDADWYRLPALPEGSIGADPLQRVREPGGAGGRRGPRARHPRPRHQHVHLRAHPRWRGPGPPDDRRGRLPRHGQRARPGARLETGPHPCGGHALHRRSDRGGRLLAHRTDRRGRARAAQRWPGGPARGPRRA